MGLGKINDELNINGFFNFTNQEKLFLEEGDKIFFTNHERGMRRILKIYDWFSFVSSFNLNIFSARGGGKN